MEKPLIFNSKEELNAFAIKEWQKIATEAITKRDKLTVALSGGRTPVDFYQALDEIDFRFWEKTHIFLADERYVPLDDVDSNYNLVKTNILNKIKIPDDNLHPVPVTEKSPKDAAKRYQEILQTFFGLDPKGLPAFDLILLGLGEDGHIASLFPEDKPSVCDKELVKAVFVERVNHERITLSLSVINNAENIIFMVCGKNKASILKAILEDENKELSATLVNPRKGKIYFLLDKDAASKLSGQGIA